MTEEDVEHFKRTVLNKLTLAVGKDASVATDRDWFVATTLALGDRVIHRWLEDRRRCGGAPGRRPDGRDAR